MIKSGDEFVAVFTKYDQPLLTIIEPILGDFVATEITNELDTLSLGSISKREYELSSVEKGLADVGFFHYKQKVEV